MKVPSFESFSIEQKIGQLFFIGIPGAEIDDVAQELIAEINPGGVCLFSRNIRTAIQTRELLDAIRIRSRVEPFLSLDQEGGLVDRLRRIVTPMPSAESLRSPEDAKSLARITSEIVRRLGFNLNFAPVVDVVDSRRMKFSNGLQSRAFGRSKEDATEFSRAYLTELESGGCLGCLKHFPGLGATEIDSHDNLPQVNISQDELFEVDLFPYKEIFGSLSASAVMVGHSAFSKCDLQEKDANGKLLPSSLSPNFVTKLLREELGFDGLVLTDDLEMGAIVKNYGIGEACKLAVLAGEDMLLICAGVESVREGFAAVCSAVNKGEISESRIDQSLTRIARMKSKIQPPLEFDEGRLQELSKQIEMLKEKISVYRGG